MVNSLGFNNEKFSNLQYQKIGVIEEGAGISISDIFVPQNDMEAKALYHGPPPPYGGPPHGGSPYGNPGESPYGGPDAPPPFGNGGPSHGPPGYHGHHGHHGHHGPPHGGHHR